MKSDCMENGFNAKRMISVRWYEGNTVRRMAVVCGICNMQAMHDAIHGVV